VAFGPSITLKNLRRRTGTGIVCRCSTLQRSENDTKSSGNWAMVLTPLHGWAVTYCMYTSIIAATTVDQHNNSTDPYLQCP
jgi:hypothetical protein